MVLPFSTSAPAPMAPPSAPAPATTPSTSDLLSMLDGLITTTPEPVYPPGYKPPKKPEIRDILSRAEMARAANQPFLDMIADTYRFIRFQTAGYLSDKDLTARRQGTQVPHISPRLLADWNRFVAYLAARPINFSVETYDPEQFGNAQKIEDFCHYLRTSHERSWARAGNMALHQAEAKDLTFFGVIVSRRTLDLRNPKCPIRAVLIDPATVFPQYGKVGAYTELEAVYRIYKTTAAAAVAEWVDGETIPKDVRDALGDRLHGHGTDAEVEVCEYWDSWWGGAFLMGTDVALKPLKAHKYGCVPYIIQYGPGGEPMHTRSPADSFDPYSQRWGSGGIETERIHKALGWLERQKRPHAEWEALTTRYLQNVITSFNPPLIIERTMDAAERMEMPTIGRGEGDVTELAAGEERLSEVPLRAQSAQQDASFLMQILMDDANSSRLPPGFQGLPDKSNVSGTAQLNAAEDGRELEAGWISSAELFHGLGMTFDVKLWRNFGHLARYGGGSKKSYYIPRRNPGDGEPRSFELTPEVIDAVDTEVTCSMQNLRLSELPTFAQAAQLMNQLGIWDKRTIARKAGITDYERVEAAIRAERAIDKAAELPEFLKGILIPEALELAVAEAQGDPAQMERLMRRLLWWEQFITQPQQMQIEAQAQPQPQGPPGSAPAGGPPQPGQGIPGGAGAPYAALGQGPGSQGAPVGAPPGPQGGPPPAPPGSYRLEP